MKTRVLCVAALLLGAYDSALAQCITGNQNNYASEAQLSVLLSTGTVGGRWVCAQSSTAGRAPGWNERHTGTSGATKNLLEMHEPGAADDEALGSWSIGPAPAAAGVAQGRGLVTYTYRGGSSFSYVVRPFTGNCQPAATACQSPGGYFFCGISGAPNLAVDVRDMEPVLNTCPSMEGAIVN